LSVSNLAGRSSQSEGSAPPLFLCHGAGTTSLALSALALAIADTGSFGEIFGISDSFLSSVSTKFNFTSIEGVATSMADIIVDTVGISATGDQSRREVALGGWSYGGVVAYECAHVLESRGFLVRLVAMVDAPLGQTAGKTLDGQTQAALLGSMHGELADRVASHFEACNELLSVYRPTRVACPVLDIRPPQSEVEFISSRERANLAASWHRVVVEGSSHFTLVQAPFVEQVAGHSASALRS